jgi:hypothetical protein
MGEGHWTTHRLRTHLAGPPCAARAQAVAHFWDQVDHLFPWFTARQLTGVNIKFYEDGWLAVVHGRKPQGKAEVAFVGGADVAQVMWAVAYSATHDLLGWRNDQYAKD